MVKDKKIKDQSSFRQRIFAVAAVAKGGKSYVASQLANCVLDTKNKKEKFVDYKVIDIDNEALIMITANKELERAFKAGDTHELMSLIETRLKGYLADFPEKAFVLVTSSIPLINYLGIKGKRVLPTVPGVELQLKIDAELKTNLANKIITQEEYDATAKDIVATRSKIMSSYSNDDIVAYNSFDDFVNAVKSHFNLRLSCF